jgi:ribosomal protein S18 acetylase RimI-like enzyme|tara:strand:+ start:1280 stop:1744 length:465 start_codon:yes stop_codon:yes gene_type:complete
MKEVQIKAYEHKYHKQFKDISLDWLHSHDLYEKADDALLDHPQKYIDNGSFIFLAHYDDEIVGTVSLSPLEKNTFEIMKLGVIDGYKGLGIGRKLMQICIDICQKKEVKLITLDTSSKLQNAIKLYEKLGFVHVEITASYYESADVKMELKLRE